MHRRAKLTVLGRQLLVHRVVELGWPVVPTVWSAWRRTAAPPRAAVRTSSRPRAPAPVEWAGPLRYGRLLGDREGTPNIGAKVCDLPGDLDRWAGLATAAAGEGKGARAARPVALFVNNRFEGAAFDTAVTLRRRLGQPADDPRAHWPEPPLPGL